MPKFLIYIQTKQFIDIEQNYEYKYMKLVQLIINFPGNKYAAMEFKMKNLN